MSNKRLSGEEVRGFIFDQTLDCFDPVSGVRAATIKYFADGNCRAEMEDGAVDEGRYGFDRDIYWTQYSWFRDGGLFRFFLERISDDSSQAFFEDGTKAFLQKIKK